MSNVGDFLKDTAGDIFGLTGMLFDETIGALWDSLTPDIPEQELNTLAKGLQKGIDQPRRITFGRDLVGGVIAHQTVVTRDDKEFVQLMVLINGAPIDALEQVFIADKPITDYPGASWNYSLSDGRHTTANAMAVAKMKGWTAAHVGYRQAHVFIELENNREVFPDGVSKCEFLIRGVRVFDPRDGSQLADDESTWQWSQNAVLNTLHYIRFFGAHPVPLSRLPLAWWIAAANVCDERVPFKDKNDVDKTEPRYCVNGTFFFTSSPLEVLSRLEQCFAGKVFRQMGSWYVRVGAWYGNPSYTINQGDVHGNVKIKWHADLRARANIVRATFTNPNQHYVRTDAAPIESDAYKLKDNQPLEKTIDLPFVHSETQAQRIALMTLEQSRLGGIEIPLKHSGLAAAVGQTVYVNLPNESILNKVYRVSERRFRLDGGVTVIAVEDSPDLWGDDLGPKAHDLTPNSAYQVGDIAHISDLIVHVNIDNEVALNWQHPVPNAVVQYDVLVMSGINEIHKTSVSYPGIALPNLVIGSYTVKVRACNIFGQKSGFVATQFQITQPTIPSVSATDISDTSVTLIASLNAIGLGTALQWQFLGELNALLALADISTVRSDVYHYAGLNPGTTYSFQCRSINLTGFSDWVSINITTKTSQLVFEQSGVVVSAAQLSQTTQHILSSIPDVHVKMDNTLTQLGFNNASVAQLKESFNQVGLDITLSQTAIEDSFSAVLEQFADTNNFVFEISEKLGTLVFEGNKVTYDEFRSYRLKVDAFESSFSSLSNKVTQTDNGLVEAHTQIQQNTDAIKLIVGNTTLTESLAIITESAVTLNRLENSVTAQSFAAKAKDLAIFEALLSDEISAMSLIESEIDFALSSEKRDSSISELEAKASSTETVIAQLKDSLGHYAKNVDVLASLNRASATISERLRSQISDKAALFAKDVQTLTDKNTALAQRAESLESKVNLPDGETVSSVAQSIASAQVSYCTIGRDTDANAVTTRADCEALGGTWVVDAPISELLHTAQVTNAAGQKVSAISYLTALEDENGRLKARAFFGIDNHGKSGILVYNTTTQGYEHTVLDLSADNIMFRGTDGNPVMFLDSNSKNLAIHADVYAKKLVLGDGTVYNRAELVGPKGDSIKGDIGAGGKRGASMFTVGTSTGAWSNTIANNATTNANPVDGDIVTIYKSSDLKQQPNTKKYNGANWVKPPLVVHGSIIAEGTLDAKSLTAHSKMRSPVVEQVGTKHMSVTASNGFGPNNEFVEWHGPKKLNGNNIDYNSMKKSNAFFYRTVDNEQYFGGQILTSESFKNASNSSDITSAANVTMLGAQTRGAQISITANYSMSGDNEGNSAITPTVTLLIQRLINSNWTTVTQKSITGTSQIFGGGVFESMNGSLSYTYPATGNAGTNDWRLALSNRRINGGRIGQNLTLNTAE